MSVAVHPTIEDLCSVPIFNDLPKDSLEWLHDHMTLMEMAVGDTIIRIGEAADRLFVIFEGEARGEIAGNIFTVKGGQVTGYLPFSRSTQFMANVRVTIPLRGASLHKDDFAEMMRLIPALQERLVRVLADRIRESTRVVQQREKLMALGKLSAGLAHELNNPAAAGRRAADSLRRAVVDFRAANIEISKLDLDMPTRQFLAQFEDKLATTAETQCSLDTLERSDREERLARWMESFAVKDAWTMAPELVESGCIEPQLREVASRVPKEFLGPGLRRLTASVMITRLVGEIESSMKKISELVKSVKEYSYMDQMPEQDVDIHEGMENTLIMLKHRLKGCVEVVREFDRSIPKMTVRGSELNQVWTNLIGNAIDAMHGKGKLRVRTALEGEKVLIQIIDSGPGIPPEIHDQIFDPFFTTKGVNEGTGLGLDIANRIVRSHDGDIWFETEPGRTCFNVRLPLHGAYHHQKDNYSPEDHAVRNSG